MISHSETGTHQSTSAANVVKLATALSVSVDYLLGHTDVVDLWDDRVQAPYQRLSDSSAETMDQVARVLEGLLDKDTKREECPEREVRR